MFQLEETDDEAKKLAKIELAIRYLEFTKSDVNQSAQGRPAINLLVDFFDSPSSYGSLNKHSQNLLISFLVNSIRSILKTGTWDVLDNVVNIMLKLVKNASFCRDWYCQVGDKPVHLLFDLVEIVPGNELILKLLVDMSLWCREMDEQWSGLDEKIMKLTEKLKTGGDYKTAWCLFVVTERIGTNPSPVLFTAVDEEYSFDYSDNQSDEEKIEFINLAIRYLKFVGEPELLFNSDQTMNILYYIYSINLWEFDSITPVENQDYLVEIMVALLRYLFDQLLNLLTRYAEIEASSAADRKVCNGRIKKAMTICEKLATILQNYANGSTKFCVKYHNSNGGVQTLFDFIKNEFLSDFLVGTLTKTTQSHLILKDLYESIIGSLHNLSRLYYKFKSIWDECDAVETSIQFSNKLGSIDPHYRFYVYMIIANIASDSQINTLPEIRVAIEYITGYIRKIADLLEDPQQPVKRTRIQFSEDDELAEVASYSSTENEEWNLIELLEALYHMSVNDNIKLDIYNTYSMRDSLKRLIFNGNEIEREFSLRLLYQLCFDDTIAQDVAYQTDLVEFILSLPAATHHRRNRIEKNCNGILWVLRNTDNTVLKTHRSDDLAYNQLPETSRHVMISYNSQSRDICLEIKKHLQAMGYRVWIDVDNISGSSLESMAKAIEDSELVLMGMTEKYKLSTNCRLEAEYAMNLNKPIVPLILQKDYKPDGWLGIILGSKMFINFQKYPFQECMERLKKEIQSIYGNKGGKNPGDKSPGTAIQPGHYLPEGAKEILEWSEERVQEWLDQKSIHKTIVANLSPCDGRILHQVFLMLQNAPEFFYHTLRNDADQTANRMFLRDLAVFTLELSNLFK